MTQEFQAFPSSPSSSDDAKKIEILLGSLTVDDNNNDHVVENNSDRRGHCGRPKHSLTALWDINDKTNVPNNERGTAKPRVSWDTFVQSVFGAPQLSVGDGTEEEEEQVSAVMRTAVSLAQENRGESGVMMESKPVSTMNGGVSSENWMKVVLKACRHLGGAFGTIPFHRLDAASFPYYIQAEDRKKNFSWKQKQHRKMTRVPMDALFGLNDALYLAQASFVHTVEDVKFALSKYEGPKYELVYCLTAAKPYMPAHYLAVKKDEETAFDGKSSFFHLNDSAKKPQYLDLLLSIRGTMTICDYLTDMMLESCDYRDGKSHHGICQSGLNIYNKHKDLILRLLKASGREKVRLTFVGVSLLACAGAILDDLLEVTMTRELLPIRALFLWCI